MTNRAHPSPAIPRNASSKTPAGCPPEISHFPSTTTAGTPVIPRAAPLPLEGEGVGGWGGGRLHPESARKTPASSKGRRRHRASTPSQPSPLEGEGYALAIFRRASSKTEAGCPPEISHFPSTTTAGTPVIPRETHSASAARTASA